MGYGQDEAWEEEENRELNKQEKHACYIFRYDYSEWVNLDYEEQLDKITISRFCKTPS